MNKKIEIIIFIILMAFVSILIFSGCNTYQKQLKAYHAFSYAHPDQLAVDCARQFPAKDSIGKTVDDSVHKANNVNYQSTIDSLTAVALALKNKINLDTVKSNPCSAIAKSYEGQINDLTNKVKNLQSSYKPCKPDIVYRTQTVYRVDEAALTVQKNLFQSKSDSLKIVQHDLLNETSTAKSRLHLIFILAGILLLSIIVTVLKLLGKLSI